MTKPTVYLDTSVINFLFADGAPEKQEITVDFFENFVKLGFYDVCVSEYVVQEINQVMEQRGRERLLNVLTDYPIELGCRTPSRAIWEG